MSTTAAVITAIGGVVTGLLAFAGVMLTVRANRSAARNATKQEAESAELRAWRGLATEYRTRLERLEDHQGQDRAQLDEVRTALRGEQLKREGMARELDRERERLTSLESRFRAAVAYIQSLLTLLRSHDIEAPPPPDGISVEP